MKGVVSTATVAFAMLLTLGCPETPEQTDAATAADAATATDARAADATTDDGAADDDAATETDAGITDDAATTSDATTDSDAATADDATTVSDAGVTDLAAADAATPMDAASPDSGVDPWPLDPNVAPLAGGGWYRPTVSSTWQWQLTGTLNTSYDVEIYDIDLFETSPAAIAALQGEGRRVLCYFSAGSSEDWRDDFDQFDGSDMGDELDGWAGERWLDIRSQNVFDIMLARLDLAAVKGCDGVEPDNVDGYANSTGFSLTAQNQLAYNRNMANAAHRRGLAVALKNDVDQVDDLVDYYDLTINEECHDYSECGTLTPFISAGKPVLNAEYADHLNQAENRSSTLCPQALSQSFRTLLLPWDLDDSFRVSCDE